VLDKAAHRLNIPCSSSYCLRPTLSMIPNWWRKRLCAVTAYGRDTPALTGARRADAHGLQSPSAPMSAAKDLTIGLAATWGRLATLSSATSPGADITTLWVGSERSLPWALSPLATNNRLQGRTSGPCGSVSFD
jgi:hypothetical protein